MPVCNAQAGTCSSADGAQSTPWSASFKASLAAVQPAEHESEEPLPATS
jgi:hypothetical protein